MECHLTFQSLADRELWPSRPAFETLTALLSINKYSLNFHNFLVGRITSQFTEDSGQDRRSVALRGFQGLAAGEGGSSTPGLEPAGEQNVPFLI